MNNQRNSGVREPRLDRCSRRERNSGHDIYGKHYEREDDQYFDPRRTRQSGPANSPNYGLPVYEDGPEIGQDYGYNQGRNAASNIGGRAYGQNYGQYFQGGDRRAYSNSRDSQDWLDDGDYRRGHAQRHRGVGRYRSRG